MTSLKTNAGSPPVTKSQRWGALVFFLLLLVQLSCWTNSRVVGIWRHCDVSASVFMDMITFTQRIFKASFQLIPKGLSCALLLELGSEIKRFSMLESRAHMYIHKQVLEFYLYMYTYTMYIHVNIFVYACMWIHVQILLLLTHWGRVTQICVSKLTTIGSDNGLSPGRRHAITWNNAGILSIRTLGTKFSEILI